MRRKLAVSLVICMLMVGCATIKNPDGTELSPIQKMTQAGYKSAVMYESMREQYLAYLAAPDTTKEQFKWLEKNVAPKLDAFQDALVSYNRAVIKAGRGQGGEGSLFKLDSEYNKSMQAAMLALTSFVTDVIKQQQAAKDKEKKEKK